MVAASPALRRWVEALINDLHVAASASRLMPLLPQEPEASLVGAHPGPRVLIGKRT